MTLAFADLPDNTEALKAMVLAMARETAELRTLTSVRKPGLPSCT